MAACRLCARDRPLQDSHIIPRFVTKWLLESSPTRGLRDVHEPNLRRQDGPTLPFLCFDCEQVLAPWEGAFATGVFLPLHSNERSQFTYDSWALKFAASIVWRVLTESLEHGPGSLSQEQRLAADRAGQSWRLFMLGQSVNPGRFEIHAIPLDAVSAPHADVSPFLNRYLLRVADAEVIVGRREVLVYAKLCRILLIGHVIADEQSRWRPSRLSVTRGIIGGRDDYYLSAALQLYMNNNAMRAADALA